MRVISGRNVHSILPEAMELLYHRGVARDSRNGEVLQSPEPVATVYQRPNERVLFHPWRDANPFFHHKEKLWMLAGRNDLPPLLRYVPRFVEYSDDGGLTQNAAYGHRWRSARGWTGAGSDFQGGNRVDQLNTIIQLLRKNPLDRQCVLQIWDHVYDLGTNTKDHACNLTATFQVSPGGSLDMVVLCRSNDVIWGCYGANAVHFGALLEYVARSCDLPIGKYTQISVNWHAYTKVFTPMREKMLAYRRAEAMGKDAFVEPLHPGPYEYGEVKPYPLMSVHRELWDEDVRNFVTVDGRAPVGVKFHDPYFEEVALPIVQAHDALKDLEGIDRYVKAMEILVTRCAASDWRRACVEWVERRRDSWIMRQRAKDDGVHSVSHGIEN